jgi:hypothetical protein
VGYANFRPGWVDWQDRSPEMNAAHERALADMQTFKIAGDAGGEHPKKVVLTDLWDHPMVVDALGFAFPGFHQLTGSCVGAGGGNCEFTLSCVEVVRLGDPEQIVLPWWLYTYGKSRQRCGMRGRGEGSSGSAYAEAARLDGYVRSTFQGLPQFKRDGDGLKLTEDMEYTWSNGSAIAQEYVGEGKQHLVKSTSPMRTTDDVRESIVNLFPCTDAYSGYVGHGRPHGSGDDAVVVGEVDSRGGHQTSIQGWQEHPELGELFLYVNQWPTSVYPKNPGAARCSVWINKRTMQQILSEGEVYSFSQFDGYPAQRLDKLLFKIAGN